MKKILLVFVFINILLLSGCDKEKYFICEIDLNNKLQEYKLNAEYKIFYKNSFVTKIEKKEVYISSNKETLKYFNEYKNLEYQNINNLYGGTEYIVDSNENSVTLNATIDMEFVDVKKMVKEKYIDRDYVISNKLSTAGIKNIYKEKGAICDI